MKIAVCPGSFDPVTVGHLDIIQRASKLFDKVIVLVMPNAKKVPAFTLEERVDMIRLSTKDLENVEADHFNGLLADYTKKVKATAIVKGLRAVSDYEYEFQMALVNKELNAETETVFINAVHKNMYLSSSIVKQVAYFGGDISKFVPECVHDIVKNRLSKREEDK